MNLSDEISSQGGVATYRAFGQWNRFIKAVCHFGQEAGQTQCPACV